MVIPNAEIGEDLATRGGHIGKDFGREYIPQGRHYPVIVAQSRAHFVGREGRGFLANGYLAARQGDGDLVGQGSGN